jgi:hypothetical protein
MKKKKQKSPAKKEQAEKAKASAGEPERDQAFDYGGLPARDLKKNLGCG